jgi:hypothetical protein
MAKRKHKRSSAADVTIRLGDIFDDKFPDDLVMATLYIGDKAVSLDKWEPERIHKFAEAVLNQTHAAALNALIIESRQQTKGPRGPRLPKGVTFADLLPHLAAARYAQASKDESFNAWVRRHEWPNDMQVTPSTARTWLRQYAKQIVKYAERAELNKKAMAQPRHV